jgi:hypothetical protein
VIRTFDVMAKVRLWREVYYRNGVGAVGKTVPVLVRLGKYLLFSIWGALRGSNENPTPNVTSLSSGHYSQTRGQREM